MWKTISFYKDGTPRLDLNNQGVVYDYRRRGIVPPQESRTDNPYYRVSINGHKEYIHILVAKNFPEICGEWFEGCEVHHKDFNPLNNDATNLRVVSVEEHRRLHQHKRQRLEPKLTPQEKLEWYESQGEITRKRYYCRKSKVRENGLAPVELSFYQNGVRYFLNTGEYADPDTFVRH